MRKKRPGKILSVLLSACLLVLSASAEGEGPSTEADAPCVHVLTEQGAVAGGCEQDGHEPYYICSLCGETFADAAGAQPIDELTAWSGWHAAPGHSWDGGSVTVEPGCETEGEALYTCTACTAEKTEAVPAAGHAWGAWSQVDEQTHQRVCTVDATHTETAEHSWGEGSVTVEPGCETEGTAFYTCTACTAEKTETVPAAGHAWGGWSETDKLTHHRVCERDSTHVEAQEHSWDEGKVTKEPTIASKGVKTYTCTVCGGEKTEELPWLPLSTKFESRALTAAPGVLAAIPELDTVEEITAALKTALKAKSKSDNMAFYDVKMLYSTDEGESWQEATAEFYPSGGKLTVIIPYPSGTNGVGYSFVAAHMFDTDEQGKTPGQIEYPTVTRTKNGLMLTMTGFSPVGISWTASGVATGDENAPALYFALFLLSGAALWAAYRWRRRGSQA